LKDPLGRVLQQAGGGDVAVSSDDFEVLNDGTVIEDGLPTGQIGLFEARDNAGLIALGGSAFSSADANMEEAGKSAIRQGFVEGSNIAMSDEMLSMMTSVRQAEGGAQLVQAYDQLLGQAVDTFGRSSK
jgi:flagellar basal body rod protein FlgG